MVYTMINTIKKTVSFDICREIIYITSFKSLRDLLWWSQADLLQFIMDIKAEMFILLSKLPHLEPNLAMKMICV